MASKSAVEGFLAEKKIAVIGASRSGGKFGNVALKELRTKGYEVYAVHPEADTLGDITCYRSLSDLPEPVNAAFIAVSPTKSATAVREAYEAGIAKIWIQQGAKSQEAVDYCAEHGIEAITGECILLHAEPVESIHKFHRFLRSLFGRMPE